MKQQAQLKTVLKDEINSMDEAVEVLKYSYSTCKEFSNKKKYNPNEEEKLEAMTSRFARLCDIILQKVWRALFFIELEEIGTVRDRINMAEKKTLIKDADEFIKIRILRNQIAHEYRLDDLYALYKEVFVTIPALFDAAKRIHNYVLKKELL